MSRAQKVNGAFERMTEFAALRSAALRASRGLRDRPGTGRYLADLEAETIALQRSLRSGTWAPGPLRTFRILDPKPRTIAVAPFPDRVVHHALCAELNGMFERFADFDCYACRKGKGQLAGVRRAQALSRRFPWYGRLDVRHFFETVRHEILVGLLARRIVDERVLTLVSALLAAGVGPRGTGLPIGNLTSQQFGNFFLGHLDHHARESILAPAWIRYMDDVVIFAREKEEVWRILESSFSFLRATLGLEEKEEATVVAPVSVGIPFLGVRIWPQSIRLDGARRRRVERRLRRMDGAIRGGRVAEVTVAQSSESVVAWASQADTLRWRRSLLDSIPHRT